MQNFSVKKNLNLPADLQGNSLQVTDGNVNTLNLKNLILENVDNTSVVSLKEMQMVKATVKSLTKSNLCGVLDFTGSQSTHNAQKDTPDYMIIKVSLPTPTRGNVVLLSLETSLDHMSVMLLNVINNTFEFRLNIGSKLSSTDNLLVHYLVLDNPGTANPTVLDTTDMSISGILLEISNAVATAQAAQAAAEAVDATAASASAAVATANAAAAAIRDFKETVVNHANSSDTDIAAVDTAITDAEGYAQAAQVAADRFD